MSGVPVVPVAARGSDFAELARPIKRGLNYQIEHHLFPNMPRPNLRRAQPLVSAFCAQRGVSYTHCGILASYAWVLRHLHEVGSSLRSPEPVSIR